MPVVPPTPTSGDPAELWWDEDFEDIPLTSTEPDNADEHINEILSGQDEDDAAHYHDSQENGEFIEPGQFDDDHEGFPGQGGQRGGHRGGQRESQGDTDEWEDCEEEEFSGTQESSDSAGHCLPDSKLRDVLVTLSPNDSLHVNVLLNPDAPSFTPTSPLSPLSPLSPEMMKTPEGHVKVPDWAAEMKTPTTTPKDFSFSSASPTSPASPQKQAPASQKNIEKDFDKSKAKTAPLKSQECNAPGGDLSKEDTSVASGATVTRDAGTCSQNADSAESKTSPRDPEQTKVDICAENKQVESEMQMVKSESGSSSEGPKSDISGPSDQPKGAEVSPTEAQKVVDKSQGTIEGSGADTALTDGTEASAEPSGSVSA